MPYGDFQKVEGPHIELQRFTRDDIPEAAKVLISPDTWFSTARGFDTPEHFQAGIEKILKRQEKNEYLVLVARLRETAEIVAMSTFHDANASLTHIEIGFTWLANRWQRTFVNTELKLLMLTYAFEKLKVLRVQFAVHPINEKSNAAMKRLGAQFEGTLRKWRFLSAVDNGDRNIYSILNDEWPAVRERLQGFLNR